MPTTPSGTCFEANLHQDEEGEPSNDVFEARLAGGNPPCAGCGQETVALAVFHRHPERLPLNGHQALVLFVCPRDGSDDDWDQWWASCALANPDSRSGLTLARYEQAPAIEAGRPVRYARKPDVDVEGAPLPLAGSKLGGAPRWSSATDPRDPPTCGRCGQPMRFVGAVTSTSGMDFDRGDGFHVWLYGCPDDHEVGANVFVE